MTGAGLALQKAIVDALGADAAVTALIGAPPRLHDAPPERPHFPFAQFGDARETRVPGSDALIEHDIRLLVQSRYDGRAEAHDIIVAISSSLDGAALTLPGYALISMRVSFTDIIHRAENNYYHGVIRLRAVTERV